jgi:hypothetical protein
MVGSSLPLPDRPPTRPRCPTTGAAVKVVLVRSRSRRSTDPHEPRWAARARRSGPQQQCVTITGGCTLYAVDVGALSPPVPATPRHRIPLANYNTASSKRVTATAWRIPRRRHHLASPNRSSSGGPNRGRWRGRPLSRLGWWHGG